MSFQCSPADIVLSCTICQDTLSTIYADDDRNNGLHKDGGSPNQGKITKLWLTECAHLTCGKHLSGGGAPFHSIHDVPRAPCPLCSMEKDDHSDKALFFINGALKGQYDENIPDAYFQTPPVQLSGGSPGLEALRFQYLSLLRSSTKTREKLMGLRKTLKRWEDKKPEIVRSLSSVTPLREELSSAGRRLMALGQDVSSIETALKLAGVSLVESLHPQQQIHRRSQYHNLDIKPTAQRNSPLSGGLRLARGSAADLDCLNLGAGVFKSRSNIPQQDSMRQVSSSSKRKRVGSRSDTEHQNEYALNGGVFELRGSRDQMPPPPIPMQQSLVYRARVPSPDLHSHSFQHEHMKTTHFQRAPITPQRHTSENSLSCLMLVPGPSTDPSTRSLVEVKTNIGQSLVNHHPSPHPNVDAARPVYARGGWQPPPDFSDVERSCYHNSPSSSLPSAGQHPVRRSMNYHQGSLIFPIEFEDRTIDPSSRSYQSISSDGSSSYRRRQSALAMQSQLDTPAHSPNRNPSPSREGRITLSRTPSFASHFSSNKGIGLSSHVRSSKLQATRQSANSSSHRQQLVTSTPVHQRVSASAHPPTHQPAYTNSLLPLGGHDTEILRRHDSFDSGLTTVNGEIRPFSSQCGLLTHSSQGAQIRGRSRVMESQAFGPRRHANR